MKMERKNLWKLLNTRISCKRLACDMWGECVGSQWERMRFTVGTNAFHSGNECVGVNALVHSGNECVGVNALVHSGNELLTQLRHAVSHKRHVGSRLRWKCV